MSSAARLPASAALPQVVRTSNVCELIAVPHPVKSEAAYRRLRTAVMTSIAKSLEIGQPIHMISTLVDRVLTKKPPVSKSEINSNA